MKKQAGNKKRKFAASPISAPTEKNTTSTVGSNNQDRSVKTQTRRLLEKVDFLNTRTQRFQTSIKKTHRKLDWTKIRKFEFISFLVETNLAMC